MALPSKVEDKKLTSKGKKTSTGSAITRLTSPDEIRLLLKKLFTNHTLLSVSFESSSNYFGSTIIEINRNEGYFVLDELHPERGHSLVEVGKKLIINTHLDGVTLNLATHVKAIGKNETGAYYKTDIPKTLTYNQRRNTYRVATSISAPIPVDLINEDEILIKAELRDISLGGVCLRVNESSHVTLQDGDYMPTCLIQVSEEKKILTALNICHVESIKDSGSLRIGAEFAEISKIDQRELGQLVTFLDRERIKKIKR